MSQNELLLRSLLLILLVASAPANACGAKRYCGDMQNCAEATYYLSHCGLRRLNRDRDGIPCERLCGKTSSVHTCRVAAQTGGRGISMFATAASSQTGPALSPSGNFRCAGKQYCRQMTSCAEARFYLARCGATGLDGNRDGVPCNSLCRGR